MQTNAKKTFADVIPYKHKVVDVGVKVGRRYHPSGLNPDK